MEWRVIEGFENYEVSNHGDVRRGDRILKCTVLTIPKCGYKQVRVGLRKEGKPTTCIISRLVAQAFLPNPEGLPTVDHIDRNSQNNNVSNLRWATYHTQIMNQHHALGKSGHRYIRKHGNRWRVQIKRHNQWVFHNSFDTLEEAIQARNNWLTAE